MIYKKPERQMFASQFPLQNKILIGKSKKLGKILRTIMTIDYINKLTPFLKNTI